MHKTGETGFTGFNGFVTQSAHVFHGFANPGCMGDYSPYTNNVLALSCNGPEYTGFSGCLSGFITVLLFCQFCHDLADPTSRDPFIVFCITCFDKTARGGPVRPA